MLDNNRKDVSMAVVRRLPRYYRYLDDLLKNDITRISSKELSERMGITASQIRQDLNCFGGFGQQGYGYNVEFLYKEIGNILGIHNNYSIIIIGAGNLGMALANYTNLERRGYKLKGIFDIKQELMGKKVKGLSIMHIDSIEEFMKKNEIDIGILAVPREAVPGTAQRLVDLGVKGLWNFSYADLKFIKNVEVENVHLIDSLMTLSYKINNKAKREG